MCDPQCQGEMKVVAFLEPPQGKVVEKTLRHCDLRRKSAARPPPDVASVVHELDGRFSDSPRGSSDHPGELTFADMDTFEASF